MGNEATNAVDVYKDIADPSITINTPASNAVSGLNAPTYSLSITEANLDQVWYSLDGGTNNTTPSGATSGTIDSGLWNVRPNGTVTITFYANDTMGNEGTNAVDVLKDIIDPIVSITTPAPLATFGTNAPGYSLSITEPNIDVIWFTLDGGTTNSTPMASSGTLTQSFWDTAGSGSVIIRFYVNDSAGNMAFDEVNVTKDLSPPSVAITSPSDGASGTSAPSFDVTITDPTLNTTWYIIYNGIEWSEKEIFAGSTGTISQTLWDSIPASDLIIRFYGNDSFGNTAFLSVQVVKEGTSPPGGDGGGDPTGTSPGLTTEQYQTFATITLISLFVGGFLILKFALRVGEHVKLPKLPKPKVPSKKPKKKSTENYK
jgi:hypothetical protein